MQNTNNTQANQQVTLEITGSPKSQPAFLLKNGQGEKILTLTLFPPAGRKICWDHFSKSLVTIQVFTPFFKGKAQGDEVEAKDKQIQFY